MNHPSDSREPFAVSENRSVKMTAKMWWASIGTGAALAVAYSTLKADIETLKAGQRQGADRAVIIEQKQEIQHDSLIRMESKIDYLVKGRRGPEPVTGTVVPSGTP